MSGSQDVVQQLADFAGILTPNVEIGKLTSFGVGGPAAAMVEPKSVDELAKLVQQLNQKQIPWRVLGGGTNVLVPDAGYEGVVVRLTSPAFTSIEVSGTTVSAGSGAHLSAVIDHACRASLTGLENLVGIGGTVGGAVRCNASDRSGDLGQYVHSVELMEPDGTVKTRMRADLRFRYRASNLDDVIILAVKFSLPKGKSEDIERRVKRVWVQKNSQRPKSSAGIGYVFSSTAGPNVAELIADADAGSLRVGGAELNTSDPRFVLVHAGATSADVHKLIRLVQDRVGQTSQHELEVYVDCW